MKKYSWIASALLATHITFVTLFYGLFLVPQAVWNNKIFYHFWLITAIVILQLLWGLYMFKYSKKYRPICILTTATQYARGFPLKHKRNFDHSFLIEFFQKLKVRVSEKIVFYLTTSGFILVVIEYIFF